MKRRLYFLLSAFAAVLVLCSCSMKNCNSGSYQRKLSENILSHGASVVMVTPFGDRTIGSGTFVKVKQEKIFLTAQHVAVIQDELPVILKACSFIDESECVYLPSKYLSDSSEDIPDDWAIFQVDEFPKTTKPARLSNEFPKLGDEIILCGIPQAVVPWLSFGNVAYLYEEEIIGVDGYGFFGSSGGGAYNAKGELVGVISAMAGSEWGPMEDKIFVAPTHSIPFVR